VKYLPLEGWFLPDGDVKHLHRWMVGVGKKREGRLLYQSRKYELALREVPRRKFAVDVGAHAGLWSWMMALDFDKVTAFEPVKEHADCWRLNMKGSPARTELVRAALGTEACEVRMERTELGMGLKMAVSSSGAGELVPMRTLDSYHLNRIDLLKVDVEGFELAVLQGGRETLLRCRPCVVVEQKASTDMEERYGVRPGDAVAYLESLGAVVRRISRGDYIMSWRS